MGNEVKYNVGKNGISGLIAQADTPIALDFWFESIEDRTFVVKFSDYCAYMATFGREGYSNIPFSRAHKIMEMLTTGQLNMSRNDVSEVISFCYSIMIKDIGTLLIKEACLYARKDSDWEPFNIAISLPVVLIDYFGKISSVGIKDLTDEDRFVDVVATTDFNEMIHSDELLNMLLNRDDISMQDIMLAKDTKLEEIVIAGIMYLEMYKKKIKGRVTGGVA